MALIKKSRINAFKDQFGKKADQTLSDFAAEIKAAWTADPQGWTKLFADIGIEISEQPV